MIFKNDKVYNALKWIALVGIYALNYAWTRLAGVWGFPYASEISETICIVGATLGILLGISAIKYNALLNTEIVEQVPDNEPAELEDDNTPDDYIESDEG